MRYILVLFFALWIMGCDSKKNNEEDFLESLDSATTASSSLDVEMINLVLQQIPSPLEISVMLKESGISYDENLLNSTSNLSKYNTSFKKAINLGIYGTDLGYTNIYGKNQDGITYITTIKSLADDLSIGQFFDLEMIRNLATNSQNLDSLMLITTQNFNDINTYLQSQNRSNLSTYFLLGGWIEALNIVTQVAVLSPENEELKMAIGDQKAVAERLMVLMDMYETDITMNEIRTKMQPLWDEFENITVTVSEGESTSEIVDGVLIISNSSESQVNITGENLTAIARVVSEIRTDLIK